MVFRKLTHYRHYPSDVPPLIL